MVLLALLACKPTDPLDGLVIVTDDPSDSPLVGLTDEQRARFDEGDALFERSFRDSTGLGPVYIRSKCSACHASDARGPGFVTKFARVQADGVTPSEDQSSLVWGHTERPQVAGGASTPLLVPDDVDDLLVTTRFGPAVFGRGYIEAVDPAAIVALAASQEQEGAVSGRVAYVTWNFAQGADPLYFDYQPDEGDIVGRFGLKARVATLDGFAGDAFQGDMSITSPYRPDELPNPDGLADDLRAGTDIDEDTVRLVGDYVRMLDIPARDLPDDGGDLIFAATGCAACHVPSLPTLADWPIEPLAGIDAPIYSDLLLHDLGPDLADGQTDAGALSAEWRTAPLIGLRFARSYLHDGRADTIEAAILHHGGEATSAVDAFDGLSDDDRATLLAWLEQL